ncbi:hypothetical protein CDN99_24230 [Roseateles aquatilis]|uniref:eCIS core domain-containing protein n=1 Tax=Roseateles aquatilis TaxID=431061 RepID=A0A246IWI2_9BURK|nr:DUF4157 domain-containing protein [Roseateles aquatilis]OWQ84407.1 hypothetical protein CDN99_24230 [Roseateles aquatilis]
MKRSQDGPAVEPRHEPAAQRAQDDGAAPAGADSQALDASPRQTVQRHKLAQLRKGKAPAARSEDRGGLPAPLREGMESLSGMSLDNVQVHYNSAKPAQLNAHAYAQGRDIHLAPGQERHLPHEAWHVVQQAQGRVKPTMTMGGGVPVNDHAHLEREADSMGAKAMSTQRKAVKDEDKG